MYTIRRNSFGSTVFNPVYGYKVTREGKDFLDYLTLLGLAGESKILALSLSHHFYFDENDLRDLRVLVILKELNLIRHPEEFCHAIFRILPPEAYFIGCFVDNNHINSLTLFNQFIDFLDSKPVHHLSVNKVNRLLESHGFRVVDMTEIKGRVYFTGYNKCSKPLSLIR